MRRKKQNRNKKLFHPQLTTIAFALAGGLFVLALILFTMGKIIETLTPQQTVFANPYTRQNQFAEAEALLSAKGFEVESKTVSKDKSVLTVALHNGPTVLFSSSTDLEWQISSLHSIMYKLTIDNKRPTEIDFRFEKPIVKF